MISKKLNKTILLLTLTGLMLASTSCLDILDKQAETTVTEEQVFGDERRTREFLNNVYSFLPDDFWYIGSHGSFSDVLTDNAINTNTWDLYPSSIRQGAISATNNPEAWFWGNWYTAMRKSNKFIENIGISPISNQPKPGDDENMLKDRYIAEARLLRALYHFETMKRFGKMVIADRSFQTDELNPSRNEIHEVVQFIATECDEAFKSLPFVYKNTSNIGRVNGATALALKTRALLYGASPLYNNQNNAKLWEEAAAAAKQLIDLAPSGAIGMMNNFPELFLEQFNTEVILSRSTWSTRLFEADQLPKGVPGSTGFTQPTQNLVDCFEMADGSKFDWNNPAHAADPYANRDPSLRLHN
jgi:starch-binding outer membrane protein, SusD/RagB family